MTVRAVHRRDRSERGVAAVEAGLITMFLSPLLMGVLFYGNYFWQAQQANAYTPRVSQSAVVGNYSSCADLVSAVKATVLSNAAHLTDNTPLTLSDITATVVDHLPDRVGVDVHVSIRVPVVKTAASGILPNNGDVVSEALTRLENARLTVSSC